MYWAQYNSAGLVAGPALCAPGDLVPLASESPLSACGNGLSAYPDAFAGTVFATSAFSGMMPHARDIAVLAVAAFGAGAAVPAAQAQPLYLRNKIAYTSAERQVINAAKAAA